MIRKTQQNVQAALILAAVSMGWLTSSTSADVPPLHGLNEVHHSQVELQSGFWGPRLKTHHEVTVPHALNCLEADGHATNFDKAAGVYDGPLRGHHAFDSDLYKALEGAFHSLQHYKDPELQKRVDNILNRIVAAQQKDGFLISYFIVNKDLERWGTMRLEHQLYNTGHLFEMAVEHERLTGQDKVLEAARRFADNVDSVFGPGRKYDAPGHEEVELALIKLYRATGEKRYLDLCRFFLDERGHAHGTERKPFTAGPLVIPERVAGQTDEEYRRAKWHAGLRWRNGRMQDHKPLIQQDAVGHAVRAGYVYSAMADIARFSEATEYEQAVERIWNDVVTCKMYVNGGLGTAQYGDEGFGDPYLLPNRTYCESCAAIANVLWQHRMNLLKAEAKYVDVMELTLYNGMLSGIAISGDSFFYQNPLESQGVTRRPWIGLSCCPTNLTRIIPQVGGLAYAEEKDNLYVNLFMNGKATINLDGGMIVKLVQETNYPWDGKVKLTVTPEQVSVLNVCLRIPGWALGHPVPSDLYRFEDEKPLALSLMVNGENTDSTPDEDGYVHLRRQWKPGDSVEMNLPMPVRRVYSHENIQANNGRVSLMRGPIVYCFEAADNPGVDFSKTTIPKTADIQAKHRPDLLGGLTVLQTKGLDEQHNPSTLTAIPYYAWANREKGPMTVWINETSARKTWEGGLQRPRP
jgi:DUF1680 family protein